MVEFVQSPESQEMAETGSQYITGKVSLVSPQQGLNVVGVARGQNPGQYVIKSNVTGGLETALTALTNKANIWGVIQNETNRFSPKNRWDETPYQWCFNPAKQITGSFSSVGSGKLNFFGRSQWTGDFT